MSQHWTFTRGNVSDVSDLIQCFMFIPTHFTMYFKFSGKKDFKKLLLSKDSKERKNRFMNNPNIWAKKYQNTNIYLCAFNL